MKLIFLFSLVALFTSNASGQSPCINTGKIETGRVARPSETQVSFETSCTTVIITWKGNADQTYIVTAASSDETARTYQPVCDNTFNCYVVLPVNPKNATNWTIQSQSIIDGRTFYSYPVRGEYTGCNETIVTTKNNTLSVPGAAANKKQTLPIKTALIVYPNPTTGELTIKWSDAYMGKAQIFITDASGRTFKSADINKQVPDYLDRITVNTLTAGIYFIQIKMQNNRSVTARFMKN